MTKLLDQALEAVRSLPSDAQDDIARVVLRLAGTDDEATPVALTPEERAAVAVSKAAAARGEFATDEQARDLFPKAQSGEIEVIETTAGQITDVLKRLGVPKERMVTVMIEPDDLLTKARQESRRLVIAAGLSDDDIDRLVKQAQKEVEPRVG